MSSRFARPPEHLLDFTRGKAPILLQHCKSHSGRSAEFFGVLMQTKDGLKPTAEVLLHRKTTPIPVEFGRAQPSVAGTSSDGSTSPLLAQALAELKSPDDLDASSSTTTSTESTSVGPAG
jgi:hypothetical protein